MSLHDRYVARLRELAAEVDRMRTAKAHDLTKPSAVLEAAQIISHPECNRAWLEVVMNRVYGEMLVLRSMPDATGYRDFQAPSLDDDDDLPSD